MARNIAVGECECPFKGCSRVVPVFKFRQRSDDPKKRRQGGKLYGECPAHGRFIDQEWLLEGVKWRDEKDGTGAPAKAPEETPAAPAKLAPVQERKTPEKPAPAPVAKSPEKAPETPAGQAGQTGQGWGFY